MATGAFNEAFRQEMGRAARQVLREEMVWVRAGSILYAEPGEIAEARRWAEEKVAAMDDETVMDILRATAPKECPECGR